MYDVNWYDAVAFTNKLPVAAGLPQCYTLENVNCEDGTTNDPDYCVSHEGIDSADVSVNASSIYECEGYRLPTEAEWENAARAGTESAYYNGGNMKEGDEANCDGGLVLDNGAVLDEIAWYCGNNDSNGTKEVGSRSPNAWGLYDTSGNVWEWCNDWYDGAYYAEGQEDPEGSDSGSNRVIRGGSWSDDPGNERSARRGGKITPDIHHGNKGFRPVRSRP